ncbi:calcium/calmodulin-dependent protein kinase type IV [Cephus cinctus]|uniref:Calcium/calmodulin-dependent protein kinase type IV n=1 Tax=Cephus cinctus TaxID=211228 RepID=A0AAJ7FTX1_CEPCN|nr:calcium/calmodulin-dependent protein kinase type IV [Cephus cinctus]XP_015608065.1 calcium/calmodulin-dependent protein kinase type IV [Cephus cinctus]
MEDEGDWLIDTSNGVFQSHYILGEIIGRGSISTIHSCLYKGRKKYACKIIPKSRMIKEETRARIKTLLKIHHENIVTVREIYEDTRRLYMVGDLASGGELLERLASRKEYSERDAAKAARDALAALEYIHGMGVCHGSVRPEKFLYATEHENSRLLLTSIGISKFLPNSYNILYCAPEVINTGIICPAADIWSLGVVIYIMLCGFEPTREARETLFPSPYWDDKTDEAKDLITELMQECPEKRPTARDLLNNVWISGETNAEHSMTDAVKHLRQFNARRKFKAATHAVRATHRAIALSHFHQEITQTAK